jgi:hypothetical protein
VATVFRLADYAQTAGTIVDLHAGTLKLEAESWSSRTAPMEGSYRYTKFGAQPKFDHLGVMVENFGLIGDDTVANLITGHNNIMAVIEKARLYHEDPLQSESWWLEANANGESAKRALLYEGSLQALTGVGLDPLMATKKLRLGCSLSRHPLWESTAKTEWSLLHDEASCIGQYGKTISPGGTAPARIARLSLIIDPSVEPASQFVDSLWVGIRPLYGGVTGYTGKALVMLIDGTAGTDTSLTVDDASAIGNVHKAQCAFATTTTEAKRLTMTMVQHAPVGGAYAHMCGRYLLLLRAKTSAGTVAVRLKFGGSTDAQFVSQTPVYITSTAWHWYEMGEVVIPATSLQYPAADIYGGISGGSVADVRNAQWEVWAERVGGICNFDFDGLVLMPCEHMAFARGGTVGQAVTGPALHVATNEADVSQGIFTDASGYPSVASTWYTRDFYIPAAGGFFVTCVDSTTVAQDAMGTPFIYGSYYPRWYNFRG